MVETSAERSPAPRVFVSYSRRDGAFVARVTAGLEALGIEVFLDRSEIAPGEDWRARLGALIARADAAVFVVTPHFAQSDICAWEVEHAASLGKKMIPLVHGKAPKNLSSELAALNFIFSDAPRIGKGRPASPSAAAMSQLHAAIGTDLSWAREHARLVERALEWRQAPTDRAEEKLLRQGDAEDARQWMARRPKAAEPPGALIVSFIEASEARERRQRERLLTLAGRAFVPPAEKAIDEARFDAALRAAAVGTLLGDDLEMRRVPERVSSIIEAARFNALDAVLLGHVGQVTDVRYSNDGRCATTTKCLLQTHPHFLALHLNVALERAAAHSWAVCLLAPLLHARPRARERRVELVPSEQPLPEAALLCGRRC